MMHLRPERVLTLQPRYNRGIVLQQCYVVCVLAGERLKTFVGLFSHEAMTTSHPRTQACVCVVVKQSRGSNQTQFG